MEAGPAEPAQAQQGPANEWGNWAARGNDRGGWGQQRQKGGGKGRPAHAYAPAHDPRSREMPRFLQRIGATGDPTVMCLDTRDGRIVSPFQHEHPFVIEVNAEAGINRLTEHNQTLAPNAGVYFTLYNVVTTNTHKLNMVIAFDVPEGVACGLWDAASDRVLQHEAFAPFDWPKMRENSPPYVDLKVKLRGNLLCHFALKSFRSKPGRLYRVTAAAALT